MRSDMSTLTKTKTITFIDAILDGMREEMLRDENVFVLGEDVGIYGGVFKATKGLMDEFGFWRCLDTPIAEELIVGAATGAALCGMRPIAEIQFCDFVGGAHDQIVQQAAKICYRTGGKWPVPIVVRVVTGGDVGGGLYHSQSLEAWYAHTPGLKVVSPSNVYDAKGLLKAAVRDNNPVLYFEHKKLYRLLKEEIPTDDYIVPIGPADIKRAGTDVSIFAYSYMTYKSLLAAEMLARDGISAEVVDLRTLLPVDKETILASSKKTGKCIVVYEANRTCGYGAEVASIIAEEAFEYLDAPIVRITGLDTPFPFHPKMEKFFMPDENKIYRAAKELYEY